MNEASRVYELKTDAPKEKNWTEYFREKLEEYQKLLNNATLQEKVYQSFFEKNPSFMPGALELFGKSGHYPYMDALISQPNLGISYERTPDFLWLAQDSLSFCPVFIEIEKPSKKMFTEAGIPNADFNQAVDQIDQWRGILKDADNVRAFYRYYSIPDSIQKKNFSPQFLLIYGRRSEYEGNEKYEKDRAMKQRDDFSIMSFDRLTPIEDSRQFVSAKVKEGQYEILHIPPTFRYRPDCMNSLLGYKKFDDAIAKMEGISEERKKFLADRYPYWKDIGPQITKTNTIVGEGE